MVENHLEMVMPSREFLTIYTSVQRTDSCQGCPSFFRTLLAIVWASSLCQKPYRK
jgi:hypothetical protein